jgi:hypothetical protein
MTDRFDELAATWFEKLPHLASEMFARRYLAGFLRDTVKAEAARADKTTELVTQALLLAEVGNHCVPTDVNHTTGPVCGVCDDTDKYTSRLNERGHDAACLLDQALVALGLDTKASREAARAKIVPEASR